MAINEDVYKKLGLKGFLGALPKRIYDHLGSLGYVGTISDRLFRAGGYLSYITNLSGAVSRYFVTLDPVLNSYYEMAAPITFSGDFEIEVEFSTTMTGDGMVIGYSSGSSSFINIHQSSGLLRANIFGTSIYSSSIVNTGKLEKIKVVRTGTTLNLFINNTLEATATGASSGSVIFNRLGLWNVSAYYFDGIIANAKFTDKSGATDVVTTFKLDQATANTEYSQENVFGSELFNNTGSFTNANGTATGDSISITTTSVYGYYAIEMTETGQAFEISFTVSDIGTNETVINTYDINGSGNSTIAPLRYGTGSHKILLKQNGLSKIQFRVQEVTSAVFSNVSVKEITNAVEYKNIPQSARELYTLESDAWVSGELTTNGDFATNSDWDLANTVISGGNLTTIDPSNNAYAKQSNVFSDGKSYIVSFSVSNYQSGRVLLYAGIQFINDSLSNGDFTTTFTYSGSTSDLWIRSFTSISFIGSIDNVSVKEVIEVVEQAAFSPVTTLMTLTESWTTSGTSYSTLDNTTSASVRVDATISNTDDGVLMEAGGTGAGVILYVYDGVLYFQCGSGAAYGTGSTTAEVSYTLPTGEFDYVIEWSADTSNAVLYVNGLEVDSQTYFNSVLTGSDHGTVGEIWNSVAANRGGWVTGDLGTYTNTITKCDIFNNQITSDV